MLHFFREFSSSLPDEITLNGGLVHAPDGSGVPLAAIIGCHCGSLSEGEAAMRPIKRFGSPLVDTIGPATYTDTNAAIFDPGFPRGARNYWKSSFLEELTDPAIDALIAQFAACPSPMSGLVFEHFHGAAARVDVAETAFPHRREGFNLLVVSQWLDATGDETNIAWARAAYDALRPYMVCESYVNYQTEQETDKAPELAYGRNYDSSRSRTSSIRPTCFT